MFLFKGIGERLLCLFVVFPCSLFMVEKWVIASKTHLDVYLAALSLVVILLPLFWLVIDLISFISRRVKGRLDTLLLIAQGAQDRNKKSFLETLLQQDLRSSVVQETLIALREDDLLIRYQRHIRDLHHSMNEQVEPSERFARKTKEAQTLFQLERLPAFSWKTK